MNGRKFNGPGTAVSITEGSLFFADFTKNELIISISWFFFRAFTHHRSSLILLNTANSAAPSRPG